MANRGLRMVLIMMDVYSAGSHFLERPLLESQFRPAKLQQSFCIRNREDPSDDGYEF